MLNIAICDDDIIAQTNIENILLGFKNIIVELDTYTNGLKLLDQIKRDDIRYNVYLLDIEMPDIDGVSLAKKIRESDQKAVIIYLTSYAQYMPSVFEVFTFDFLLKPIDENKLKETLSRAEVYLAENSFYFDFVFDRKTYLISGNEIIFFQKEGRSLKIFTTTKMYRCNMSIKELNQKLRQSSFSQCHGSFVVNLSYVSVIQHDWVCLGNYQKNDFIDVEMSLPISRSHRKEFGNDYITYLRKII